MTEPSNQCFKSVAIRRHVWRIPSGAGSQMHRALVLVLLLALPQICLSAEPRPAQTETSLVAKAVMAHENWMSDAKLCPTKFITDGQAISPLVANECGTGHLADCLTKCSAGTPSACYWLAYALQQTKNAETSASEALYQRACKLGVMSGCTNHAAGMLVAADDVPTRMCAAKTFAAVCKFDDPWACTMNAFHLSEGIGTKKDLGRALKSLERSCKFGPEDPACVYGMRIQKEIQAEVGKSR